MTNITSFLKKNRIPFAVLLVVALLPLVIRNQYVLSIIVQIFIFAAMGSAWNILGGYASQISWAHAAFVAIGAYTGMLGFLKFGILPWATLILGVILADIFGLILAIPAFRLRGTYFSLATIACGQILRELLVYFYKYTGGNNGLVISTKWQGLAVLRWKSEVPYYYIFLTLLVLVVLVVIVTVRSKLGYYLQAIKEDQDAAESLGIRSTIVKTQALLISSSLMAIIGLFYAFKMAYIDPAMVGSYDLAVKIGMVAIIGGIGTVWGPLIGAAIIIPLMEMCNAFLPPTWNGASLAIYGLLLVVIVLFRPKGIWSLIVAAKEKYTSRKENVV